MNFMEEKQLVMFDYSVKDMMIGDILLGDLMLEKYEVRIVVNIYQVDVLFDMGGFFFQYI